MTASDRDDAAYCREVESYLCRKNDGHLIRLVGPAFDMVRGWASNGIPLSIVCRGIDQCVDRYYAKGPRRRPVRIEFCEADVLDLFDHWRRATGISLAGAASGNRPAGRPRESLHAHLERVLDRLGARAAEADLPTATIEALSDVRAELEPWIEEATPLRGERRRLLLERLPEFEAALLDTARRNLPPERLDEFARGAALDLEPFRERMTPDAFARAHRAATDRLVREGLRLPRLTFP